MKKYNLSNIMKRAWELFRSIKSTFGECLKRSWAIAKEAKTMKGTEKQVAWANDIKKTVIDIFEDVIASVEANNTASAEQKAKAVNGYNDLIRRIQTAEHAVNIIDMFKDIRRTGDLGKDFYAVSSVYRIKHAENEEQRYVLNRIK